MKKMSDLDLTAESLKAAAEYIKHTQQEGLSIVEKSKITNAFAHGFYCGWRKLEEENSLEKSSQQAESNG